MKNDKLTFFRQQKKMLLMAALAMVSFNFSFGQTLVSTDFSGGTLPVGWDTTSVTNDGNWAFDNPGGRDISNGVEANFDTAFAIFDSDYHCGSNEDAELVTPAFNANVSGTLILSFDNSFRNYETQEGHVEVWNGSSWTDVLTLSGANDGYPDANHKVIDITAAAGASTAAKVRFHWENGSCDWWWAIDNVTIKNVTCFSPSSLAAVNATSTGATLTWNSPASAPANGYQYYYSTSNTTPSATIAPSGSTLDTSVSISGLTAYTQYYFWVRSICSTTDTSDWSPAATFTTQPAAQIPATLPYTDDFTSTSGNWTLLNGSETNRWYVGSAAGNPGNSLFISDDNGTTNEYDNGSGSVVQAYRDIVFPSGSNPFSLKFDWQSNGESCCDFMRVWLVPNSYIPTPGTQITASASGGLELDDKINGSSNWNTAQYIIPDSFAGTTSRLVFEWKNDGSVGSQPPAAVDNIELHEITCSTPVNETVSNVTATGATLSWNDLPSAPANGYQYYYSNSNTAPTAATIASGTTTDTFATLSGLTGNTQYYCWVRSVCSATDTSDWSVAVVFFTSQIPATLPYTDDFTSTSDNWTLLNGSETNQWYVGSAAGNPGNSLFISDDNGTTNEYDNGSGSVVQAYRDIVFPSGSDSFNLTFDWQSNGESCCDYMRVWLVPNSFIPTPGTQITASASGGLELDDKINGSSNWNTAQYIIPDSFAGTTSRLVFEWKNDGSVGSQPPAAVDNIDVMEIFPCLAPDTLTVTAVTATTADLSWNGSAADYTVEYDTAGFTLGTGNTVSVSANTYTVSNLDPNTDYDFYVRSVCTPGTDSSDYSVAGTFTTTCNVVTVVLGSDTSFCPGDTITLDAGNSGSTYLWSDNSTSQTLDVFTAGDYSVTVTNEYGCSGMDTIMVSGNPVPIVDLGADTSICEGQTLTLDAANPGSNYLWSDASTNQTLDVNDSGYYSVTVTDTMGCSGADTIHIGIDPLPSASSITVTDNGGGSYTFSAEDPSNVVGYSWDFGDGSPVSNTPEPTHTYAPGSDTFTVTLIITNNCGSDTLTTTVASLGINKVNISKEQLKLYPNPTRDRITVQNESTYKMKGVTVYNVLGQVVIQQATTNTHRYTLDVSGLTSGLYTVRIETSAGFVMRKFEVLK